VKLGSKTNGPNEKAPVETGASSRPPSLLETSDGDGTSDDDEGLAKGTSIGRYLVLERLGAGAMGVVYAAYDPELDRKIAIKLLRPEEGKGDRNRRQERLVREAKAIAKLSHPNVVGIFDVGVHDGQVFLAMEYLGGGTLRDWVAAKKRPWREIVRMFIEVGRGLAAALAEGLIHRDFKPDNVLLDKQGKPKVVDFGLVRLTSAALEMSATGPVDSAVESTEEIVSESAAGTPLAVLTRTGALTGTPAYMAAEQFLGRRIDARTDQFAFCVTLYEALYGERPFAGNTPLVLGGEVTRGNIRDVTWRVDVPGWLRKVVIRGLSSDPSMRFGQIEGLLDALARNPIGAIRQRAIVVAVLAVAATLVLGIQRRAGEHRRKFEAQIAERMVEGKRALSHGLTVKKRALQLRTQAFGKFDLGLREDGERAWKEARAEIASADQNLERAEQSIRAALSLDSARGAVRALLGDVIFERALLAELEFRRRDVQLHVDRMNEIDLSGALRDRWSQPGGVTISAAPSPVWVRLEQFVEDDVGRRRVVERWSNRLPPVALRVEPGSYLVSVTTKEGDVIRSPFRLERGQTVTHEIELPRGKIPSGYAFVPSGWFLLGEADESFRTAFLDAVPIHPAKTGPFLIGQNEVTYAQWLQFLSALPKVEADARAPFVSTKQSGAPQQVGLQLRRSGKSWVLALRPGIQEFTAAIEQPIHYSDRRTRQEQRWTQMPVGGISVNDIEAFLAWLRVGLKGARLCTDAEWERAARGADDRIFPHGDLLDADDANFDLTYGRKPLAFGPDEVGSHPMSASPFGVQDMAGNIFEIVRTRIGADEYAARGGAYYYDRRTARVTNREPVDRSLRYPTFGFRVCADVNFGD
jgi:formylglycine-generating enzyme required for sulfatase activity/tRNA A-37 threonylcarbamoyl transferase component Bud32